MDQTLLQTLETYYDAAPRPSARAEEVGPFTLYVNTDPDGFAYYARPRLGLDGQVSVDDVRRVLTRQQQLDVPRALEWVHQTTPSLLPAAREAGLRVQESPLLVLDRVAVPDGEVRVRVLGPDDADLPLTLGAVSAGFAGSDDVVAKDAGRRSRLIRTGLLATAAAYDDEGAVVGGGSYGPRGAVAEIAGVAVVPRARRRGLGAAITAALVADAQDRGVSTVFLSAQDDAVARIYERVGFVRVGTACIAREASS